MSFNILCLKWGDKYSADYVNKLHSMVERHLSLPHRFVCLTDDATGINPQVECKDLLEESLDGWWNKLSIFKEKVYDLSGPTVFIDLDVVITGSIDFLFEDKPDEVFIGVADFLFPDRTFNSSVFRFNIGEHQEIHDRFNKELTREPDGTYISSDRKLFVGDQDWITYCLYPNGDHTKHVYQKDRIISYKKLARYVGINKENRIVVFHGNPNPHEADEGWIKKYWT